MSSFIVHDTSSESDDSSEFELNSTSPPRSPTIISPNLNEEGVSEFPTAPYEEENNELSSGQPLSFGEKLMAYENIAVDYLCTQLHHPVIGSFRDLTRKDIQTLYHSSYITAHFDDFEVALLSLVLIDYVAVSYNNPLYNEYNKFDEKQKTIAISVKKLLNTLRKALLNMCTSTTSTTKLVNQQRCKLIIVYIRRISHCFKPIDFFNYITHHTNLMEKNIRKKLRKVQFSAGSSIEPPLGERSILSEIKDGENKNKPKKSSKKKTDKKDITTNAPKTVEQKNKANSSKVVKADSVVKTSVKRVADNKIIDLTEDMNVSEPSPKKQKVEVLNAKGDKKVKNAFSILMNRSREIALEKKKKMK